MSRDVKHIGMDVHKEAVVIAVQNTRGHAVRVRDRVSSNICLTGSTSPCA
jgi:methylase of polypeptide subunit release factors